MKNKGQNLIEFIIIIALVIIGSIFALTMLGGNVTEILGKTNNAMFEYKPFGEPSNNSTTKPTTKITPSIAASKNIDGIDINFLTDGTASFNIKGQDITLSSDILSNINTTFEAVGTEGINTEIIKVFETLIEEHSEEFAPNDVPLTIAFGKGKRETDVPASASMVSTQFFEANSDHNVVAMSVGSHHIIIQQDQYCNSAMLSCNNAQTINFNNTNSGLVRSNNDNTINNATINVLGYDDAGFPIGGGISPGVNLNSGLWMFSDWTEKESI